MKNFTRFSAVCALALGFFAIGCDDDTGTTPTANKKYYPLVTGSYQVNRNASLDSGNVEIAASVYMDSVVIGASTTYAGKSAFMKISNTMGIPYDTVYVSGEGNTAMWFMNPVSLQGLSDVEFPKRWVTVADFNSGASSWTTFDTTVTNLPMEMNGQKANADAKIKQTVTKGSIVTISYGSNPVKTVSALEFTNKTAIEGTLKTQLGNIPVKFDNIEKMYFADGIGLVQHKRDYNELNLMFFTQPIYGFNYLLHHYHSK